MNAPASRIATPASLRRSLLPLPLLMMLLSLATLLPATAFAQAEAPPLAEETSDAGPLRFRDTAEEQHFHALTSELRCVMCQNQSLADSNAQIAHDLRREVLTLMREGRSDEDIREFLVARYGEFVLYRPRMSARTWLLWLGPLLFALVGGVVILRIVRARGSAAAVDAGPPPEQDI